MTLDDATSTAEASKILSCSTDKVRSLVNAGKLDATVIKGNLRISRASLDAYLAALPATPTTLDPIDVVSRVHNLDFKRLPKLLTAEDLVPILGEPIWVIRQMMRNGELPIVRLSQRRAKVSSAALVLWLLGQTA